jgi:hypothetical protein
VDLGKDLVSCKYTQFDVIGVSSSNGKIFALLYNAIWRVNSLNYALDINFKSD